MFITAITILAMGFVALLALAPIVIEAAERSSDGLDDRPATPPTPIRRHVAVPPPHPIAA